MVKQTRNLSKTFGPVAVITVGLTLVFSCQSGQKVPDPVPTETSVYKKVNETPAVPVELSALGNSTPIFDVTVSSKKPVDGSMISVGIHPLTPVDAIGIKVVFEGHEFPVFLDGSGRDLESLVVIPFNSKPRETKIDLSWSGGNAEYPISVIDGNYPSEKLSVDAKKVNPPKKVMKRIIREVKEIRALYTKITPERYWSGRFSLPIDSEVTSQFGNKRLFNGSMKSFHQGLDLRARTPTPIHAPGGGRVVLSKDLYFTGNTVILDHGYGLFTIYGHMSKLLEKVGDRVAKGQTIGISGATGRVNGPHLHWGAVLMHEKFNPADLTRVPH